MASEKKGSGIGSLFVGKLSSRVSKDEVEDKFRKYGPLSRCELRSTYAFVTFEDMRDAEDAFKCLQGAELDGVKINIEWTKESGRTAENPPRTFGGGRTTSSGRSSGGGAAGGSDSRPSYQGAAPAPSTALCYECSKPGHFGRDCPVRASRRAEGRRSSRSPPPRRLTPPREQRRSRSRSPPRRRSSRDRDYDRAPPPPRDDRREPYDDR